MQGTATQAATKLRAGVRMPPGRRGGERGEIAAQMLTLLLQGITAGDYLTWVRNPDPDALGRELRSLRVQADPLGDRIEVMLAWEGVQPDPRAAAAIAGFVLTPEVVELRATNQGGQVASSAAMRCVPSRQVSAVRVLCSTTADSARGRASDGELDTRDKLV